MYHSAENNYLDITVEIRSLGIPWTLYCWMQSLGAAHEARLDCVIDQLLQDFLQVCPDDYSQQFVQECLPLLFNIFRYSKVSETKPNSLFSKVKREELTLLVAFSEVYSQLTYLF